MDKKVSIIIPTRNRVEILRQGLEFLAQSFAKKNAVLPHEIIVINDGGQSLDEIGSFFPSINIYNNPGSGVAAARNFGASKAKHDILFFVDDDMLVSEEAVNSAIAFHSSNSSSALNFIWQYPENLQLLLNNRAFGRYLQRFGFTSLKGMNKTTGIWSDDETFQTPFITSQNLSMLKSTFEEVGGYDESFPFAGFEDWELSKRLGQKSVAVYINPKVMTWHNEADRLDLHNWLQRKYRGGVTRKVAVSKGISEVAINYPFYKVVAFKAIATFEPLLIKVLGSDFANRAKMLDMLFFRVINVLLACNIYKGYTEK